MIIRAFALAITVYLFLNNGGVAKRVTVEAGQRFNRYVEVISDEVIEGAEVVTQGQARLIDGVELLVMSGTYEEEANSKSNVTVDSAAVK